MATERQLRRRMNNLQKEIDQMRGQSAALQANLIQSMDRRLADMKNQYQNQLVRIQRETEAAYIQRVRAFQENVINRVKEQNKKIREEYEHCLKEQQKKINELEQCSRELNDLIGAMQQHAEEVEELHRSTAETLLREIDSHRKEAEKAPHEFFFDGEYGIIDSHARQIKDEIEAEMFQAAAANANSVIMEFDLLRIKVNQAYQEWLMAFLDYELIIRAIHDRLVSFENTEISTVVGKFALDLNELNYWSSGTYGPFRDKIEIAYSWIQEIRAKGIELFLKKPGRNNRKDIFSKVTEANRWYLEMEGITNCILSERMLSDERWAFGKTIAEELSNTGYHPKRKGFRPPDNSMLSKPWNISSKENAIDCYDMIVTINDRDLLRCTLVPVRQNGVVIRNECILSLDAETLMDLGTAREVLAINQSRIESVLSKTKVFFVQPGIDHRTRRNEEEKKRKMNPSPTKMIESLEKKYPN